jgi:VIT1/CCC1 family predicted Fe2+/Mn2+ transporter
MSRVSGRRRNRPHSTWLRDLILGGQDGLVNVLGISLGLSAVTEDVRVVIAAGLAATFAESASMGAVAYTSSLAVPGADKSEVRRTTVIVTVSTLLGSILPLAPFFALRRWPALIASVVLSGCALFAMGAYEGVTSKRSWQWMGIQLTLIGLGAALVGFLAGRIFKAVG